MLFSPGALPALHSELLRGSSFLGVDGGDIFGSVVPSVVVRWGIHHMRQRSDWTADVTMSGGHLPYDVRDRIPWKREGGGGPAVIETFIGRSSFLFMIDNIFLGCDELKEHWQCSQCRFLEGG